VAYVAKLGGMILRSMDLVGITFASFKGDHSPFPKFKSSSDGFLLVSTSVADADDGINRDAVMAAVANRASLLLNVLSSIFSFNAVCILGCCLQGAFRAQFSGELGLECFMV